MSRWPDQPVTEFCGSILPERATPAGYAALIQRYQLDIPAPPVLSAIARRHHPTSSDDWRLYGPRYRPEDSTVGQLVFALKWEGMDLQVLSALFEVVGADEISAYLVRTPTGIFARRLWFIYEWITSTRLEIPDLGKVRMIPLIDASMQYCLTVGVPSNRHKVIDNLPGTPAYCPMVRKTTNLIQACASRLCERSNEIIGPTRRDLIARAAAFLQLKDSKSSFEIEGEPATSRRMVRWATAIADAGRRDLTVQELERLQGLVLDHRFVKMGLRSEGGFIGEHDRESCDPVPEHISARPDDLPKLIDGLVEFTKRAKLGGLDPVVSAAIVSFGFVYIHPFIDGNGRIHRWLIHHVLASMGYNPTGILLPISAAILRRIEDYGNVLRSYSSAILPFIDWMPTPDKNVKVLNQTSRFYQYFDATVHAEFLYRMVKETVERDLPDEVAFLEAQDAFQARVGEIIDLPAKQFELLIRFLIQNDGILSKRAREIEFALLQEHEAAEIELIYQRTFGELVRLKETWQSVRP